MHKIEVVKPFIDLVEKNTVFIEIGTERGFGSTLFLADLALSHEVKLFSVDIDDILKKDSINYEIYTNQDSKIDLKKRWRTFYNNVKDTTWPNNCDSIDDLPEDIKKECIEIHDWFQQEKFINVHNQIVKSSAHRFNYQLNDHPALILIQEKGSDWCKKFSTFTNKKISFLYLDNFDFIYEDTDCSNQILDYKQKFGLEMNNQNCQIEHFKQILYLIPYLDQNCVVACDDTFQHNGCWVGKSGAVVVYLLALGFDIVYNLDSFVILKRKSSII
jgi:hypothetical protein